MLDASHTKRQEVLLLGDAVAVFLPNPRSGTKNDSSHKGQKSCARSKDGRGASMSRYSGRGHVSKHDTKEAESQAAHRDIVIDVGKQETYKHYQAADSSLLRIIRIAPMPMV